MNNVKRNESWFEDYKTYNAKYVSKVDENNRILTNEVRLNLDYRKTRKNNNVFIVADKREDVINSYIKPNMLQGNSSFVVHDIGGKLYNEMAKPLEDLGYKIKVLNFVDVDNSLHYNPFHNLVNWNGDYAESVNELVDVLVPKIKNGDPFWYKAEQALMKAVFYYMLECLQYEERTFENALKILETSQYTLLEELGLSDYQHSASMLDAIMEQYREFRPDSMAVKHYDVFKMAGTGATAKSIIFSAKVKLQNLKLDTIKPIISNNTLDLDTLGDEKQALFIITPEGECYYDDFVNMVYSQIFDKLHYKVWNNNNFSRLSIPVMFIFDEKVKFPNMEKTIVTSRKSNMEWTIIASSLKAYAYVHGEAWQVMCDCCDSFLFFSSNDDYTLEYINKKLGFGVYGKTDLGNKVMTVEKIKNLPDNKCLLFIRGLNPFYCNKYK